jgi:hypothetical protein
VGDGLALGDLVGDGVAAGLVVADAFAVVFAGAGFEVGGTVDPLTEAAEVPATAEATALAAAESAGAEAATAGDDTGAPATAEDAAAGPDDAALLLCEELEHAVRASAATTVAPTKPVTRTRTIMSFPPAGMRQQ